jgi:3-oxoacyl-[acyl-carrier protein] reductase
MTGLFHDRRVLVTGAARGIGLAIARAFHEAGASVALVDMLPEVEEAAKSVGDRARAYRADVTDPAAVKALIESVVAGLGGLDVVVNNAGITRDGLLARMSAADFDSVLKVNLYGTFHLIQAAARPMMKARGGRIINIASVIGLHGNAGQANYAASKGAVIALTKAAAKELASRNITVNAVAPGFIRTAMTDRLPEDVKTGMLGAIPLGRLGEPEDVAAIVLFLAGDGAAYVTGQVFVVDGGMFI